tara:strand:- start:5481 stop:5585 length:105 start_codon:yes stop_codon:yes gene_type:complete
MKYIKWIIELINELGEGLTSNGYKKILPKKDGEQ